MHLSQISMLKKTCSKNKWSVHKFFFFQKLMLNSTDILPKSQGQTAMSEPRGTPRPWGSPLDTSPPCPWPWHFPYVLNQLQLHWDTQVDLHWASLTASVEAKLKLRVAHNPKPCNELRYFLAPLPSKLVYVCFQQLLPQALASLVFTWISFWFYIIPSWAANAHS